MTIQKISRANLTESYKFSRLYGCDKSFAYFKNKFKRNPELFAAYYKNKNLIGVCWGFVKGKEAILLHIGVDAKYWKKGIGRELLRFWERQVRMSGKNRISLGAAKGPINVVGFYTKFGYKPVKEKSDYIIMEKELNK